MTAEQNTQTRSPQETRTRILEAALEVFSREGFSSATTRSIAAQAHVNEVTLFRHFGNKQKLFSEVVKNYSVVPDIQAQLERADGSLRERLRQLAQDALKRLVQRREMIGLLLSEGPKNPTHTKALMKTGTSQILNLLTELFRDLIQKKQVRDINPEYAARVFWGPLMTFFIMQYHLPGDEVFPIDEEEYLDAFIDLYINGCINKETES